MTEEMGHKEALEFIEEQVKKLSQKPEQFLQPQVEKTKDVRNLLQLMYKVAVETDITNVNNINILPELVLDGMDEEQIWQQLEIRNMIVMPQLVTQAAKMLAIQDDYFDIKLQNKNWVKNEADKKYHKHSDEENDTEDENASHDEPFSDDHDDNNDDDDDNDDDEELSDEDIPRLKQKKGTTTKKTKKHIRPSIVDDKFFKLEEMRDFLKAEDAKELKKQKGILNDADELNQIDLFKNDWDDDSEDENNCNYKDFFESGESDADDESRKDASSEEDNEKDDNLSEGEEQSKNKEHDDLNSEVEEKEKYSNKDYQPASTTDDDSELEHEKTLEMPMSSYENRQKRLESRIRDYEDELLSQKPWQLKGEIQATHRPQNSLLEEVLDFESNVRPAPIITEDTTRRLEDIIKQRIKDQAWDDVERKTRTVPTPQEYRNQIVLNQEKSKESLAQIYEKEFNREMAKLDPNVNDNADGEEPMEHGEVRKAMTELFYKLDTLFQFHFTPRPAVPEIRVITNIPALSREEVLPMAVSDAQLLAPEEVYRGPKVELLGKSERTHTDKKRDRRKKKHKQRVINKVLEARDAQRHKLGIPLTKKEETAKLIKKITKHRNVEKITTSKDAIAPLKSSKAFFSKLQETTHATASAKLGKKKKFESETLSAKKLKL